MTLQRFLAYTSLVMVLTSSTAFPQSPSGINETAGILDVLDLPNSKSRSILYVTGVGETPLADRTQLDSQAAASGMSIRWLAVPKARVLDELAGLTVQNPTFAGVKINEITFAFAFADAENVDVGLDLNLKSKSQETSFIDAANEVLGKLSGSQSTQFNARPAKITLATPDQASVIKAINADLADPASRLAGCKVSSIVFTQDADVCSTVVEGTVAFEFQTVAVIESVKSTLEKLDWEQWTEVKPADAGFINQLPDMTPFIEDLRQTLRDEESTALKVILLDARLQSDENAPGQMLVILEGHTSTAETIHSVVEVANGVATRFFAPYGTQEASEDRINVRPDYLALKVTSRYSSKHLVRLSRDYAQANRLDDALNAIELAAFEDKRAMETMYWLAVTQLKTNDIEGARKSLRIAVRENGKLIEDSQRGNRNRYSEMLHTLEPVQGTLRQELHELEGQVYADYNKVKRGTHLTRGR